MCLISINLSLYLLIFILNNKYMSIVNYVNSTMSEINELTDNIYEALMDENDDELKSNVLNLIKVLKDLQKTHENYLL